MASEQSKNSRSVKVTTLSPQRMRNTASSLVSVWVDASDSVGGGSDEGNSAVVRGGRLTGAKVTACDLRGGAALVIAGLAAEGVTEVCGCGMIDRGYERFEDMLGCLGGDIVRISGTED